MIILDLIIKKIIIKIFVKCFIENEYVYINVFCKFNMSTIEFIFFFKDGYKNVCYDFNNYVGLNI